jgi:hypothetical protein
MWYRLYPSPFCIFFLMDELWVTDGWVHMLTAFSMCIFGGNQLWHGSRLAEDRVLVLLLLSYTFTLQASNHFHTLHS